MSTIRFPPTFLRTTFSSSSGGCALILSYLSLATLTQPRAASQHHLHAPLQNVSDLFLAGKWSNTNRSLAEYYKTCSYGQVMLKPDKWCRLPRSRKKGGAPYNPYRPVAF
jgi:hypothetical protein